MEILTSMSELIRWDVPFAEWSGMSAWLIKVTEAEDVTIVVAPLSQSPPQDNYPKYLIRYGKVLKLLFYDETVAEYQQYHTMRGWIRGIRAYRWVGSPSLESYQGFFGDGRESLSHHVVLGDDYHIEVISNGEPQIERIDTKKLIEVKFEV